METSFIREYKNAISKEFCDEIIDAFSKSEDSGKHYVSNGAVDNGGGHRRADLALYLDRIDGDLNSRLNEVVGQCWREYLTEFKFLQNTKVISYACKVQKTMPMGGFHVWHWEHAGDPTNLSFRNRLAVWTLYLTDHENEGETEFLAHGLKVAAEAGKFCIFPADYTGVHRGNPVYKDTKYIVTGWYEYYYD